VVEDARHAWNAASLGSRETQIENDSHGDWHRFCDTQNTLLAEDIAHMVILHDRRNIADDQADQPGSCSERASRACVFAHLKSPKSLMKTLELVMYLSIIIRRSSLRRPFGVPPSAAQNYLRRQPQRSTSSDARTPRRR
jgi:hypothetical protein